MQVAAAQTGVPVSDGSSNVLPVGSREQVRAAWARHAGLVRRSLERGVYQGWDLHPAQLPTRFAATFAFFRDGADTAGARLRSYLDRRSSARCWTSRPPPAPSPATCAAAWTAARSTSAELEACCGLDAEALAALC